MLKLSRTIPVGSVPLAMDHEYGEVPPETAIEAEYGMPSVAVGIDEVVNVTGFSLITIVPL